MVQGYYSLEEAAQILGMSVEQLSQMAQQRKIRAFADRGTWRFRTQDVEEMARQRGRGSEPDLQFNDKSRSRADSPRPQKKAPLAESDAPVPLAPDESDQVEIGKAAGDSGKLKSKSSSKNLAGSKSPSPKPGSDSDVRLVPEGSGVGFQIASDNDLRLEEPKSTSKKPTIAPEHKSDSSVRIVPMESDSDVKILPDRPEDSVVRLADEPSKSGTDSDIRLELSGTSKAPPKLSPASDHGGDDSVLTEDIDLDAELRRKEEASKVKRKKTQTAPKDQAGPKTPKPGSGPKLTDSSSDFELTPAGPSDQPTREEEIDLGGSPSRPGHDSGIRLHDPKDSGISLEQTEEGSSDLEFELTPSVSNTPKPAKKSKPQPKEAPKEADSDSEFELTLDDSGLKPLDSDSRGPADSDKDIFETDFEVPALEDDSGSEAVALDGSDTDLESSDFELAIGDEDMVAEDESGSQVVALDDEADEAAATVARNRRGKRPVVDDEGDDYPDVDEEDERQTRTVPVAAEQPWGVMVPIFAGLTFVVIFVAGLMSFELVHGMWGYRQSSKVGSVVVDPLTRAVMPDNYLPKE